MKKLYILMIALFFGNIVMAQWQQANIPYNGIVNCIALNGNNIYIGSQSSGIFKSVNNGKSWLPSGLSAYNVNTIAIKDSTIYAGTSGFGLFKSTNNGNSWSYTGLYGFTINKIVIQDTNIFAGTTTGLYLSANNGISWTSLNTGLVNLNINSLAVSGSNIFAVINNGLFLSSNNGTSWTTVNIGLPYPYNLGINSICINGSNIFAGTSWDGGVYLSTNNGSSWTATSLTHKAISVIETNGNNIYAGTYTEGLYLSTNNGNTWSALGPSNINIMGIALNGNNIFTLQNGGGVYSSINNGNAWEPMNTGVYNQNGGSTVFSFASIGSTVFAGSDRGLYKSTNNGKDWITANTGLPYTEIWSLAISGNNIYAGTVNGVYLSTDNGNNWAATALSNNRVISLTISGSNIYAGANGVFLSSNNGSTWTAIGLTGNDITSLCISGGNIYAGTPNGVYFSTNNGSSWSSIGLNLYQINSLVIIGSKIIAGTSNGICTSSNNGSTWFITGALNQYIHALAKSGSNIFAATQSYDGILLSTNNGNSWATIGPSILVSKSIVVSDSNLFAGVYDGKIMKYPLLSCNTPPSNQATSFTSNLVTDTSMNIGWTRGNGDSVLVLAKAESAVNAVLDHGITYNADSVYGNGTQIGNGNFVVYKGTGTSINVKGLFPGTTYHYAIFEYNSMEHCYKTPAKTGNAASLFIPITIVTQPANQIVCSTSFNTSFTVIANSSNPIYAQWQYNNGNSWANVTNGIPSGAIYILSNSGNLATLSVKGISVLASHQFRCCLSNCNGINNDTSDVASLTIYSSPLLPSAAGTIIGLTSICSGQTSVTYTVPNISNATSYIWTLPSGVSGSSTTNAISINYSTSFVSGSISVYGVNSCGSGISSSLVIMVNPIPLTIGIITGVTIVCQGQNTVTYTVPSVANATLYLWTLPAGVTGLSTSNTITVNYENNAVSGNIIVKVYNACGDSASSTLPVTINLLPVPAGTISGLTSVCKGQNSVIYSIPAISNATSYIWTLPNGANGTSSTNSITVNYGTSAVSGNITVKGNNACGAGVSTTLAITVIPLPANAGTISGLTVVCLGQNAVNYNVPAITNATSYSWTLPNGASGTSSTNSITVNYGTSAVSGNITVKGINLCGEGDSSILVITVSHPPTSEIISGATAVYQGQNAVVYSCPSDTTVTSYSWDIPNGSTAIFYTSDSMILNYSLSAVSGYIILERSNLCGNALSSLYITVNPFVPNCSAQFDLVADTALPHHYFIVNNASGVLPLHYNWSWGDGTQDTISFPTHTYSTAGYYNICLTITDSVGCTVTYCDSSYLQKSANAIISITVVPQGYLRIAKNGLSDKIKIYPNPASDKLTIDLQQLKNLQNTMVSIYDIQGKVILKKNISQPQTELYISSFAKGVYVVKVSNDQNSIVTKFVKE
ncbi:MAG: T9SS type A sorting domain-containing protein [Bacteroidales bacterium]